MAQTVLREVLVEVEAGALDGLIEALVGLGGRPVHVYPPRIVVAAVPPELLGELEGRDGVVAVDAGEVPASRFEQAPADVAAAFEAWNRRKGGEERKSAEGASWDDPRFSPPDPPADVRERLRRRQERFERDTKRDRDE